MESYESFKDKKDKTEAEKVLLTLCKSVHESKGFSTTSVKDVYNVAVKRAGCILEEIVEDAPEDIAGGVIVDDEVVTEDTLEENGSIVDKIIDKVSKKPKSKSKKK